MACEYALVHAFWTIPLAVLHSVLYWPLRTSVDAYRIAFLVSVAVVYTIPWDSYLIRHNVWTYPPDAVLGYKVFEIPAEELFFFVIQTYITSLIYLTLSKPVLHLALLSQTNVHDGGRQVGIAVLVGFSALGAWLAWYSGVTAGTYLGLILVWSCPVVLFLWILASDHILRLPYSASILPILLPTAFLWTLDTVALHRGTWVIQSDTKLGVQLWLNFDIEEALFFLLTNVLVTFGQIAFDKCYAIILAESLSRASPDSSGTPSISLVRASTWRSMIYAFTGNTKMYDTAIIARLSMAQNILGKKSRSFSIASSVFEGALRVDLINLYAFCRVVDDIVDDSGSGGNLPSGQNGAGPVSTIERIALLRTWLKHAFPSADSSSPPPLAIDNRMLHFMDAPSPAVRSAFDGLPRYPELRKPLLDMLLGFEMDCAFVPSVPSSRPTTSDDSANSLPVSSTTVEPKSNAVIQTEDDLFRYASYVAGTVAEMCVLLAFRHCHCAHGQQRPPPPKGVIDAAVDMGIALQLINIARDIEVDAALAPSDGGPRVYVPSAWRDDAQERSTGVAFGSSSSSSSSSGMMTKDEISSHRIRLLNLAFSLYTSARPAMSELPGEGGARRGMIVAVESYVQIGRELLRREKNGMNGRADGDRLKGKATRASVPKWKRVWIVWWTLFRN